MHIETITIENYKSFLKPQTIFLEPGFNLLVGTNNAGKTSVLDVIDLDANLGDPHRSTRNIPEYGGQPTALSRFEVTIETRYSELRQLIGSNQIFFPVVGLDPNFQGTNVIEVIRNFINSDEKVKISPIFGSGTNTVHIFMNDFVQGLASAHNGNGIPACHINYATLAPSPEISIGNYVINGLTATYPQALKPRIYRFSAQRRPGYQCSAMINAILDREATSLPYCINHLQTNDAHGHKILCGWVNRVFPSVKWVQATPTGSNFELRCLPHLPEARRDDLAIPIARMGAGIGNVIAMFYVVLTARSPQVIAIDEPNAFLHPRALRELLAILEAEGKQHQFILTAHSPDVLTAVNARSISLLDFDGVATQVLQVGQKELHVLRGGLAELGIRMTDLHAKDRVLWVEGQTEELVMPSLLRWGCSEVAAGTSVLRVERTGTFSKKGIDPSEVAKIYERLSESSAMVPPMVCILLDGEKLSASQRHEIEDSSQGKLRFLDRRMLENYLLHSKALEAAFRELGMPTALASIEKELIKQIGDGPIDNLDGASILSNVFSNLTESKLEFRKTRDVPILIDWLLFNEPDFLAPLRVCLRKSFGI
jgi:hypothetical protein